MTLCLRLQLPSSAASVWKWHLVSRCACAKTQAYHRPPHRAVLGFFSCKFVSTPNTCQPLAHTHKLLAQYFYSSFSVLLSEKLERVQLYKAMASTFFMSEIYGVMYLLLAWLLLNLEIKQSDTEYIALSIGFVQVKNADHAMSIPWVQKHYFTTWAVDT